MTAVPPAHLITKSRADRAGRDIRRWILQRLELDDDQLGSLALSISHWRQTHAYPLALVTPGVRHWVAQETHRPVVVAQRLKRFDRILHKLVRFPSMRLTQTEDIAGCRAVVENPAEVEAVARRILRRWEVREVADYRESGKAVTGYRSLHIVVLRRHRLAETQLRTPGQHHWAEQVERTSSRVGTDLKDGEGPAELLEYFRVASDLTWQRETHTPLDKDLQAQLSKLREVVRRYFGSTPPRS